MKIFIGSDHAGFELKERIVAYLTQLEHEVVDMGATSLDPLDNYPDFIRPVAEAVAGDREVKGIVIGKSGQGEAMCANRVKGVRAALWYGGSHELIKLSREHNDSNVLSLGAGFIDAGEAFQAIKLWLETPFSNEGRHIHRIAQLDQ